jgi:hypothetical protein
MGFDSHLVWQHHEGFISLVLAKDPEALKSVGHKTHVCQFCSIQILSGMLMMEIENLKEVIASAKDQME